MPSPPIIDAATSFYSLQVRFCETDLMGIVHHANYLVYCEAARVHWLHRRGISYQSWAKHGIHLPVAETNLRFKMAAHFDDELTIETTMIQLRRVTVRFRYNIRRDKQLLCTAETLLACVGDDMKLKRFPEEVSRVFMQAENAPAES